MVGVVIYRTRVYMYVLLKRKSPTMDARKPIPPFLK